MNLIEFENGRKAYLPETLGECTRAQARDVSRCLWNYNVSDTSYEELLSSMLLVLLDVKVTAVDQEILENIAQLSQLCRSFFEEVDGKLSPILDFQENPFLWLRPGLSKYVGPKDLFDNITWGQYVDALDAFAEFNGSHNAHDLQLLVASLFREKSLLSRKLSPYIPNDRKKHLKGFERLDYGYLYGFWLYFGSFQKYLSTSKIYREDKELDLSIIFKESSSLDGFKSDIPGLGMLSLTFALAESGEFGDRDKVNDTPMWDVIIRMYDMKKRELDDIARNKKNS
jgi:hypothetical protein